MDEDLSAAILKASRHSMGMDASPVDMTNIVTFCERMVKLAEYRRDLYAYLVDKVRHRSASVISFQSFTHRAACHKFPWFALPR